MKDLVLPRTPTHKDIRKFQEMLEKRPGSIKGEDLPVTHRYAEGLYCREFFHKKGQYVVGKMHARSHFFLLLSGEITVWTEAGLKRLKAPFVFRTEAGTKRVAYAHQDSVVMTFHSVKSDDIFEVEREIIVPDHLEEEFLLQLKLERAKEYLAELELKETSRRLLGRNR